jgi:hypothetical protein
MRHENMSPSRARWCFRNATESVPKATAWPGGCAVYPAGREGEPKFERHAVNIQIPVPRKGSHDITTGGRFAPTEVLEYTNQAI